jgi:hypothetical protein
MGKQDENGSDEGFPKSLIESFNSAYAAGRYHNDLSSFVRVSYLLFRTRYAANSDRLPPSYNRWLSNLRAFERDCENAEKKQG